MLKIGGDGALIQRHEMLRHNEFYQFGRMIFGKESSPHEVHWAIRDVLQDAGATVDRQVEALQAVHWTMTQDTHVGQKEGCESDYVTFHGALIASKGQPVPRWGIILTLVFGLIGAPLMGAYAPAGVGCWLLAAGTAIYTYWIRKYGRGKLYARYEGVYRRPESGAQTAAGVQAWEFQLDLMLSYGVEIPPFGLKALGPEVVQPVFESAKKSVVEYARSGLSLPRYQPQLLSKYEADYAERFPLRVLPSMEQESTTSVMSHELPDGS